MEANHSKIISKREMIAEAFDFMLQLVQQKIPFSQESIQQIHDIVTKGLLKDSGKYRTGNVRIYGASITPPSYIKVISLMDEYIHTIKNTSIPSTEKSSVHPSSIGLDPSLSTLNRKKNLFLSDAQ